MFIKSIPLKHHLWILFAVAAMTIPFLDKATHTDDTIYIYAARKSPSPDKRISSRSLMAFSNHKLLIKGPDGMAKCGVPFHLH
jgi:hypothetical protein